MKNEHWRKKVAPWSCAKKISNKVFVASDYKNREEEQKLDLYFASRGGKIDKSFSLFKAAINKSLANIFRGNYRLCCCLRNFFLLNAEDSFSSYANIHTSTYDDNEQ